VTIENRVVTATQEIRWFQFVSRALFDDRGRILETQAVARDITERKRLEEALRSARDSAVQANEVKSRFLAAASHDLRQPLQSIWSLQALLSRVFKDSAYGPQIALLGEAVQSMDTLLSALIDINRLEIGAIQPVIRDVSLQSILAPLRAQLSHSAAEKSIGFDVEDSSAYVRSDPMLLPVMLRNLLGDAIKNTEAGTVRLRVRPEGDQIYIDVGVDGAPGVSPDHVPGVGPGLPIVQTIGTLLNHAVSISSTVEARTTFTVRLDRGVEANAPGTPLPEPMAVAAPHADGAKRILHIEDDPAVARSMAMLLSLEGYEVAGAASRDEALQQIGERGFRPDLILCDFQFPQGITGDAIVSEIASRLKFRPPTILLTGDIANKHIKKAGLVADRIFAKPVNINALLQECETLLALHP
jgi:two-component system CheB/CheR fusion protein